MPESPHNFNLKHRVFSFLGFLIFGCCSLSILFFVDRTNHSQLISLYFLGWLGSFMLFTFAIRKHLLIFVLAGVLVKLFAINTLPKLSDDIYRFIWDGILVAEGKNPYLNLPSTIAKTEGLTSFQEELYTKLNSKNYFTVYPPFNQLLFGMLNQVSFDSIGSKVFSYRLLFILFEMLLVFCLWKILPDKKLILLLILNPFWWLELYGNLHFELLEVTLLVVSLLFIKSEKWLYSALSLGLAMAIKLHLILVAPFVVLLIPAQKRFSFSLHSGLLFSIWFLVFQPLTLYQNMFDSVKLFVQNFEFNASIFYIIRWLGFKIVEYDIIRTAGPILSITAIIWLILNWFRAIKNKERILEFALFGYTGYLLLASIVHPWYLVPLLVLGVFTKYYFPFVWAIFSILSYSAYQENTVVENAAFLWIEYGALACALFFEVWLKSKKSNYLEKSIFKSLYHS